MDDEQKRIIANIKECKNKQNTTNNRQLKYLPIGIGQTASVIIYSVSNPVLKHNGIICIGNTCKFCNDPKKSKPRYRIPLSCFCYSHTDESHSLRPWIYEITMPVYEQIEALLDKVNFDTEVIRLTVFRPRKNQYEVVGSVIETKSDLSNKISELDNKTAKGALIDFFKNFTVIVDNDSR